MQCAQHPETAATAYCSNCGLALCSTCAESIDSRVLCSNCSRLLRSQDSKEERTPGERTPRLSEKDPGLERNASRLSDAVTEKGYPYCSPNVCLVLGLIPGVGSVCNGEYHKGFLQVLLFGILVSLAGSPEVGELGPLFGVLAGVFFFYMPLQAYHLAKKRKLALRGITVISPFERIHLSELWVGGVALSFGLLFLVNQFVPGTLHFVSRGWPLALIGFGIYNLARYFRS